MTLERRLERVAAFFRLTYTPYDPDQALEREGPGTWYWLMVATWLMMFSSLIATAMISRNLFLTIELAFVLTVAMPVAHRLHFRRTSRLLVNWLTFGAAFLLGPLHLYHYWPLREGIYYAENVESMAFLVLCFMWITAFRAFALRTVRDLVETILPCGSIILLVLVVRPTPVSLACMAFTVLGALALLAGQHRVDSRPRYHPLARLTRTHTGRRAGAFYSWPTLYALVLIVAVFVAWAAARSELSGGWADYARYALARHVIRWMQPRENFVIPDPSVSLARLDTWPNGDRTVFKVVTKQPGNYRTTVYHTYTGVWWQQGVRRARVATKTANAWDVPIAGTGASRTGATLVEQEFIPYKVLVGTIPSLFCPVSVEVNQRRLRYNQDRVLSIPHLLRGGERYKVTSYTQPVIPIPRAGTALAAEERARDLQLPPELSPRIRELALELTRNEVTPYQKARALEQHFMYEYTYTLNAPSGYPMDFVEHFLFVSKRGFCHHFAGSMVIMCRTLGLPARLAGGYLQGEEDAENPDLYTVRERDAHVWPEVYFAGAGWVSFEPTPAGQEEESGLARAWREIVTGTQQSGRSTLAFLRENLPAVALLAIGLLLLLGALKWQGHRRRWRRWGGDEPVARVVRAYVRMRLLLADAGLTVTPTLTPREALERLPEPLLPVKHDLVELTERYLVARFGPATVTAAEATATEQTLAQLRQHLRQSRRRR